MDALAFQDALRALWRLLAEANQYLVAREPWKMIKSEGATDALSRVLWNGLESVRIVATGSAAVHADGGAPRPRRGRDGRGAGKPRRPGLGRYADRRDPPCARAAIPAESTRRNSCPRRFRPLRLPLRPHRLPARPPSRCRLQRRCRARRRSPPTCFRIDQFFATELKVGTVRFAEHVPKSDKLIRDAVDLGEESPRQLVAGIGKAYTPEELMAARSSSWRTSSRPSSWASSRAA